MPDLLQRLGFRVVGLPLPSPAKKNHRPSPFKLMLMLAILTIISIAILNILLVVRSSVLLHGSYISFLLLS